MRGIMSVAAAATFAVMASSGLARASPQPVRRGSVDLSSPYIPPERIKPTHAEIALVRQRETKAEEKRARKAARLQRLVASGGFAAA